jgi:hypothetical protein
MLTETPGAKVLSVCKSPAINFAEARIVAEAIEAWRQALPVDLTITSVSHWSSANSWIIFLLAMGYRLECVLFRTMRQQADGRDDQVLEWSTSRLLATMFELDTLLGRAMVHDVIQYCPPSLYAVTPTHVTTHC